MGLCIGMQEFSFNELKFEVKCYETLKSTVSCKNIKILYIQKHTHKPQ
jgi:hypothetical protein